MVGNSSSPPFLLPSPYPKACCVSWRFSMCICYRWKSCSLTGSLGRHPRDSPTGGCDMVICGTRCKAKRVPLDLPCLISNPPARESPASSSGPKRRQVSKGSVPLVWCQQFQSHSGGLAPFPAATVAVLLYPGSFLEACV